MLEFSWRNATLLQIVIPVVLIALLGPARYLPQTRRFVLKHPFIQAIVDIVLILAAGWSIGIAIELGRKLLTADQEFLRPGSAFGLAILLAASISIARLVEACHALNARDGTASKLSRLSRTLLYGSSLSLGAFVYLAASDFPRLTLFAGGLAALLAFALRQTLTDVVAGLAIGVERPFRRRDWVMLEDGRAAEIIDMDWRATHFRGWDHAVFIVPNARLAQQNVKILPKRGEPFAETFTVLISGDENPKCIKALLEAAVDQCDAILHRPKPVIRLADASSLPYRYTLWVHFDGYMSSFSGVDELFTSIHDTFREAGVRVTTEMQDVRYEAFEDRHRNG